MDVQAIIDYLLGRQKKAETIQERFEKFHDRNPEVYGELVRLAREAKASGRDKIGIKMLFEVVRWNRFITTKGDAYKLNNDYHSRYSRLIMANEEDLAEIFNTRNRT